MRNNWYEYKKQLVVIDVKIISCTESTTVQFHEKLFECFKDGWFAKGNITISQEANNGRVFTQKLVRYTYN